MAFILYAIALTIATHWPRLTLGPDVPATDKEIHIVAFALATLLLWMTRWRTNFLTVAVVVIIWAGVDELTQAIPVIQRTCSWLDFLANLTGIALASFIIWAFARWRPSRPS